MAPLLKELSTLEVEPLDVIVHAPESEQDNSLDTLTVASSDLEVAALLTGTFTAKFGDDCCCCCPCCVCCCCG